MQTKLLAKLARALRGDKYMANAYPPQWHSATDAGPARQTDDTPAPEIDER